MSVSPLLYLPLCCLLSLINLVMSFTFGVIPVKYSRGSFECDFAAGFFIWYALSIAPCFSRERYWLGPGPMYTRSALADNGDSFDELLL